MAGQGWFVVRLGYIIGPLHLYLICVPAARRQVRRRVCGEYFARHVSTLLSMRGDAASREGEDVV